MPKARDAFVDGVVVLEDGAARLRARLAQDTGLDYFRHVSTTVGDQPVQSGAGGLFGATDVVSAANIGEVTVELAAAEDRRYDSEQLGNLWREETGPIPEAVEVAFDTSLVNPGNDVDVQLSGPDLDQLRDAAAAVRRRLAAYAGVYAISDSFRAGKPERRLDITPAAQTLGLTLQDLGRQVRQAFYRTGETPCVMGSSKVVFGIGACQFWQEEWQVRIPGQGGQGRIVMSDEGAFEHSCGTLQRRGSERSPNPASDSTDRTRSTCREMEALPRRTGAAGCLVETAAAVLGPQPVDHRGFATHYTVPMDGPKPARPRPAATDNLHASSGAAR